MHALLTISNDAKLYCKYWYIGLTNQMTNFQLFLGALRNPVFFPYTYDIRSQLLWCKNMCYSVQNTCYLTLCLRWVLVFTSMDHYATFGTKCELKALYACASSKQRNSNFWNRWSKWHVLHCHLYKCNSLEY